MVSLKIVDFHKCLLKHYATETIYNLPLAINLWHHKKNQALNNEKNEKICPKNQMVLPARIAHRAIAIQKTRYALFFVIPGMKGLT